MNKQPFLSLLLLLISTLIHAQTPSCGGPISTFPPAEDCASACIYCDFNGYIGSTAGYTGNGTPVGGFCSQIQNDQWLGFIAGTTSATITVTPSNCVNGDGVQVALYPNCNESYVVCNGGCAGCGNQTISIDATMVVGANYYLLIDGFSGDECDFTVSVSPANALQAQPIEAPLPVQGMDTVCQGAVLTYQLPSVLGASAYIWSSAVPGTLFNGKSAPAVISGAQGTSVKVTFPNATGNVPICVRPANACEEGPNTCKVVYVKPRIVTELPPITIGPSQLPYTLPWGDVAEAAGTYEISLTSHIGCDSTVRQQLMICEKTTALPPFMVCADSCVTICGQQFCQPGIYTVQCGTSPSCDSLVKFSIVAVNPPTIFPGTKISLNCKDTALIVNAIFNGDITWHSPKNLLLSNTHSLKVSVPGIYIAKPVTAASGGCSGSQAVTVKQNIQKPQVAAKGGTLSQNNPTLTLTAKSTASGAKFSWTGPSGFSSKISSPTVTLPGTYIVVVVDPSNGCSNSASVMVKQQ